MTAALLLATLLGIHAHCEGPACQMGVTASLTLTCEVIPSIDLSYDVRPTGLDGVSVVDVTQDGQGQMVYSTSVLYIMGSTPATIIATEAGPRWDLPSDALAYQLFPGDEQRALHLIARAMRYKHPRAELARLLRSAELPSVMLASVDITSLPGTKP